jgi:hypothetical protein
MRIIFAKSAAKHQIPKSEVLKIINQTTGIKIGISKEGLDKLAWIGLAYPSQLVEVVTIDFITYKFVIHAMPISKRKGGEYEQMEGLW